MKFSAFFVVLSSFVLGGFASTPAMVQDAVAVNFNNVVALNTALTQLQPNGAIDQLLNVQNSSKALIASLKISSSDFKGLPSTLSDSDASRIFAIIKKLIPVIRDSLKTVVVKKDVFGKFGLSANIKLDLSVLNTESDNLIIEMIKKAPAALKGEAGELKQKLDSDFVETIKAM